MLTSAVLVGGLMASFLQTPADSTQKQIGLNLHTGFIIPHAPDLQAISQTRPVAMELTLSKTALSRSAYERCNCFARIGGYIQYVTFQNPGELGRTYGLGGYFEPLIRHRHRLYVSLRATAGLSYLTRVYDAQTNPQNTFFSSPLSGLLAVSAGAHYRLSRHLHLSATAHYNHISNGGIRQPNRGMNFPTAGVGVLYMMNPLPFPNPARWSRSPIQKRFTKRILAFGSVRTLPQTDTFPEQAGWLWGVTATAGYRLNRLHAITGGIEFVDDAYIRGQLQRAGETQNHRQLGLLGGYELWLGRYAFTTHAGWNLYQPDGVLGSRVFQRYQLLYSFPTNLVLGISLKARLSVAEGFDIRAGLRL